MSLGCTDIDKPEPKLLEHLSALLNEEIVSLKSIRAGGNSRVYQATSNHGRHYAIKQYFTHPGDSRDRLATEFGALRFLWDQGVRVIPEPLAGAPSLGLGVYGFVSGEPATTQLRKEDVEAAVSLAAKLHELSKRPAGHGLPAASEACFSLEALHSNLAARLARIRTAQQNGTGAPFQALADFLQEQLDPAWARLQQWSLAQYAAAGWHPAEELPRAERTLSPSDFGFHNAIRTADGGLIFLDFEYFGWDDPAKMISDFLYHPASNLPEALRPPFLKGMLSLFGSQSGLRTRLRAVYPLYGLKWCCILLNEFVPEFLQRRQFSGRTSPTAVEPKQWLQLDKAKGMLTRVLSEYGEFPERGKAAAFEQDPA